MKFLRVLCLSSAGLALVLSGCSHKSPKAENLGAAPTAPRPVDLAPPGSIGSTEKSEGQAMVQTQLPSVAKRTIQADINRMTLQDFQALGLPAEKAQKVIDYRKEHGRFNSVNELQRVSDMDQAWLNKMQDKLGAG